MINILVLYDEKWQKRVGYLKERNQMCFFGFFQVKFENKLFAHFLLI